MGPTSGESNPKAVAKVALWVLQFGSRIKPKGRGLFP